MKTLLLFLFVSTSALAYSQNNDPSLDKYNAYKDESSKIKLKSYLVYGYVNGIRLDSINAKYGEFFMWTPGNYQFDYGQERNKRNEMTIKVKTGGNLIFEQRSLAAILNFMNFNGWEPAKGLFTSQNLIFQKK